MNRTFLPFLVAVLGLTFSSARAQATFTYPETWIAPKYRTMTVAQTLDEVIAGRVNNRDDWHLVCRAGYTGDRSLIPRLKQVVEAQRLIGMGGGNPVDECAFDAMKRLGESDAYFLGIAALWPTNQRLARMAIEAMALDPNDATFAHVRQLRETVQASDPYNRAISGANEYEGMLDWSRGPQRTVRDSIHWYYTFVARYGTAGHFVPTPGGGHRYVLDPADEDAMRVDARWAARRMGELGRRHPALMRQMLDSIRVSLQTQAQRSGVGGTGLPLYAAAVMPFFEYVAFPPSPPGDPPVFAQPTLPPPSPTDLAHFTIAFACAAPTASPDTLEARFNYTFDPSWVMADPDEGEEPRRRAPDDTLHAQGFGVAVGPENRLVRLAAQHEVLDGPQVVDFFPRVPGPPQELVDPPGGVAVDPGPPYVFAVRYRAGAPLVWRVKGQEALAPAMLTASPVVCPGN